MRVVMRRFKYNTVHILDSGAAYFGSDNVGLCGIAWYFKVRATPLYITCLGYPVTNPARQDDVEQSSCQLPA